MLTFVFPGQGSQRKGMGGTLFEEFKELTAKADEILGFSIKDLCLEDSNRRLVETQHTQPALYVVNALSYLKKIKETGKTPTHVAGHSLGEYNALFAAGVFDFETGLKLVKKRGELMGQVTGGGMAAVIGLSDEKVKEILEKNNLDNIEIANYNTPRQIALAGLKENINCVNHIFEREGAIYIPLNVSGAFHSTYMNNLKQTFGEYLELFRYSKLNIPVISNANARPYIQAEIKKNLTDQITHPVRWTESVRYLMGQGKMEFEEIGPGNVLTRLIQEIQRKTEPLVLTDNKVGKMQKSEIQHEKKNRWK